MDHFIFEGGGGGGGGGKGARQLPEKKIPAQQK